MSEQSGQLPGDIVKVEMEEEDERNGGNSSDTLEGAKEDDKDMEMLKAVTSLLSNGPWLCHGTEAGESLAGKLLSLGERLMGWKEWERLGRMKEEKNRELAQRLQATKLLVGMVKEAKTELRRTYDLEVEQRIKAELEVVELRKKIAQKSVAHVLKEVVNVENCNEDLQKRRSGERANIRKPNKVADSSCNRREYSESSGSSSDSDDGESDTDSDDDMGRGSGPELRRKIAQKPLTQDLQPVPAQATLSSKPDSSIGVLQLQEANHAAQVAMTGVEIIETSEEASSEVEEAVLQEQEDDWPPSADIAGGNFKELTGSEEAVPSDAIACPQKTSYTLRRKSRRRVGGKAVKDRIDSEASPKESNHAMDQSSSFKRNYCSGGILDGREKPFQCDRCDAVFSCKSSLNRHIKLMHVRNENRNEFFCYVCNKRFLYKNKFLQHLRTHPEDQSYKCKTCDQMLKDRNIFRMHLKTHDPNRKKQFACPTCSKTFFKSAHLADHLATHRAEKPFKCPQCPQGFKLSGLLKKHLVVHSDRKPFQCELCEMNFKRSCNLEIHLRVHTGERPYACQICKKGFTQSSHLNIHMSTHQGKERKHHPCPFCHMKFVHKSSSLRHQRSHHKSASATSDQEGSKEKK